MADCPDCGTTLELGKNWLTDDEYTSEMDCPSCGFSIETSSNLVGGDDGS